MPPMAKSTALAVPRPQVVKLRYIDSKTLHARLSAMFPAGGFEVEYEMGAVLITRAPRELTQAELDQLDCHYKTRAVRKKKQKTAEVASAVAE